MIRRLAAGLAVVMACAACGPGRDAGPGQPDSGEPGVSSGSGVESELGSIESTLDEIEAELAGG